LTGTPEDWSELRRRAGELRKFDLDWWIDELDPILAQFESASRGEVDRKFWQGICKQAYQGDPCDGALDQSNHNGWIGVFYPFRGRSGKLIPSPEAVRIRSIEVGENARSVVVVDFVWEYMGRKIPMQATAGMLGFEVNPESGALRPAIGWYVSYKDMPEGAESDL
jgi:hypothetical protein